jgi:hypothetical protein
VTGVVVSNWSAERHEMHWKASTGYMHKGTRIGAQAAVEFLLAEDRPIMVRSPGVKQQVRQAMHGVIQIVGEQPAATVAPVVAEEGDRYDQLRRIAALRDDGILTDEEFEREKRRILE